MTVFVAWLALVLGASKMVSVRFCSTEATADSPSDFRRVTCLITGSFTIRAFDGSFESCVGLAPMDSFLLASAFAPRIALTLSSSSAKESLMMH